MQYAVTKKRLLAGLGPAMARQLHCFIAEEGITAAADVVISVVGNTWTVEECGDRDPSGARVGAILQALIAREPVERRPTIRAWLPRGFVPPQVTIVSEKRSTEMLTILLAAIFTGLSYPVYQWLLGWLRGRKALAAIATLVLLLALVMAPLLAVLGAGANEALRVTETIRPRLQQLVDQPGEFDSRLRALPGYHRIEPYRAQILTKAGELVGSTSAFLFAALSATTRATAVFIFHFFVLLYTMFFFLTGGPGLLRTVSGVPAAHGSRQATHGGEVRVGYPRDAQGHDPDRRGSGPAWRVWRSGQ